MRGREDVRAEVQWICLTTPNRRTASEGSPLALQVPAAHWMLGQYSGGSILEHEVRGMGM
ncbi:MAG: hypothetical protein IPJ98_28815 [Bryobacterales bacterium]|nr:hypothetical protein [Bryobacterales bacterium]